MSSSAEPIFPAAQAGNSVESLYAMHGVQRPWIYWLCLLGVGAALGALPLIPVEITIRAGGIIRPAMERIELKAAVGGRVARVCARDNEQVGSGQPLVELSAFDVEERIARNRALQREKAGLIADLVNLTGLPAGSARGVAEAPAGGELRTPMLAREWSQFLEQFNSSQLALDKARTVHDRTVALAAKGLLADQERDEARYALARATADRQLVLGQTLSRWQTQLRDEQTALDQLVSEERRLGEERALAIVRAPVAGTVQGLVGLSAGTNILAGQSVGFVSPDDRLLVETYVSSKDIALLHAGQRARLQVDAYPYTQWGLLDGVVESVAADATTSGSQAAFRVTVRPSVVALHLANGSAGVIRKGMTLTARFVLGRRTLLQVLYEDATRWLDPQGQPSPS